MAQIKGGDVRLGCAESAQIKYFTDALIDFRKRCPGLRFHIFSGGTEAVLERLDQNLLDLAILAEPPYLKHYNYVEIPRADRWGA